MARGWAICEGIIRDVKGSVDEDELFEERSKGTTRVIKSKHPREYLNLVHGPLAETSDSGRIEAQVLPRTTQK